MASEQHHGSRLRLVGTSLVPGMLADMQGAAEFALSLCMIELPFSICKSCGQLCQSFRLIGACMLMSSHDCSDQLLDLHEFRLHACRPAEMCCLQHIGADHGIETRRNCSAHLSQMLSARVHAVPQMPLCCVAKAI